MNTSLVSPDAALGAFVAGALFITFVVLVLLAVGGLVVVAYLLLPPVRRSLDRRMHQQEADIWTETLAFVDAETEKYRRQHRKEPRRWTNGDVEREAGFKQGELYGQAIHEELPF